MSADTSGQLLVLWTSTERETVDNMVFLYTMNSKIKGWWEEVTLLIWGSTARLVAEDETIRENIQGFLENGIRVIACRKCAENLGVAEKLESMGIEVFYTGEFLTEWMKSGKALLSV
ncbi:MAG TPA: DsrE family protein [Synergistaceae bacterium]|nr:MAG: Uncharacterized protein XD80_0736 [Synergistales bacterium 53_16]KUL01478.1 MAG: Uncharacterized protein XE12_1070 [Synergistales bacterium 54_9]MDN5336556.1 hypothetical protein [Synergistales bacterium]HAA46896.1 DsrE family protein [Synergistaceae bacterium]HAG22176.1 DsrE family protein [Synergistaceae bacterium]